MSNQCIRHTENFTKFSIIDNSIIGLGRTDVIIELIELINFREFLVGITYYLYETTEHQIKFSFQLFDINNTGYITDKDLKDVLLSYMSVLPNIGIHLTSSCSVSLAEKMVEEVFKDIKLEVEGKVSYEEYKKMYLQKNYAMKWLTMDMERLNKGVALLKSKAKAV